MKTIFWGILVSILVTPLSLVSDSILKVDLSFIINIIGYGLILKGLSSLNRTQRNLQNVKTFTIILLSVAVVNGVLSLVKDSSVTGGMMVLMMASGVLSLLNEYHLIKGYQSYSPLLTNPNETVYLLKVWKNNLIASVVLIITLFISAFAVGLSFAFTFGTGSEHSVESLLSDPEILLHTLRPSAPIFVILLVILTGAIFIAITTRILWLVSLYQIQKDHQQGLLKGLGEPVVE